MFFVGLAVWSGAVCFPHSLGKHSWVSSNTEIFHPFFSCVSNVQWNCKVRGCTGVQYKGVKHLLIPWGTLLACIKCLERLDLLDSVWAPMLSFVAWLLKVLFKKQFNFWFKLPTSVSALGKFEMGAVCMDTSCSSAGLWLIVPLQPFLCLCLTFLVRGFLLEIHFFLLVFCMPGQII